MNTIPFNQLAPLYDLLADEIQPAVERVMASGWFILGPEVAAFEQEFAAYHGVKHAVGVANGTDAIELALRVASVGPGDEVITVSHTAVATVCAIEQAGAVPVLVDIDPQSFTIDPAAIEAAITPRTRAIIPVHLYGHPAAIAPISEIAARHNLLLIEDCAQAHGARSNGQLVGTFGHLAAFSFYPTKNLGAYGDGGAILTNDDRFAERLRRLRSYGQTQRYIHAERGVNSRLDELQAAILRVKLRHLDEHNQQRRQIARIYDTHLREVMTPTEAPDVHHVYHLYVVRHGARDALMQALAQQGVGTLIHYPVPVHLQDAYDDLGYRPGSLPVTEQTAREILSLPMYIGLKPHDVERAARAVEACSRVLS